MSIFDAVGFPRPGSLPEETLKDRRIGMKGHFETTANVAALYFRITRI